jgi:hypothetical protein
VLRPSQRPGPRPRCHGLAHGPHVVGLRPSHRSVAAPVPTTHVPPAGTPQAPPGYSAAWVERRGNGAAPRLACRTRASCALAVEEGRACRSSREAPRSWWVPDAGSSAWSRCWPRRARVVLHVRRGRRAAHGSSNQVAARRVRDRRRHPCSLARRRARRRRRRHGGPRRGSTCSSPPHSAPPPSSSTSTRPGGPTPSRRASSAASASPSGSPSRGGR